MEEEGLSLIEFVLLAPPSIAFVLQSEHEKQLKKAHHVAVL